MCAHGGQYGGQYGGQFSIVRRIERIGGQFSIVIFQFHTNLKPFLQP